MINNLAQIDKTAQIADNVEIGPWSIIGPGVVIEEGTRIGPHVIIHSHTRIGKNNQIFPFACLGDAPQDKSYQGENTALEIGDNNIIREYVTISRGTVKGGGLTKIGNENFIMAYVHIGHDCTVGNEVILTNYSALSGHVTLEDFVTISGFAAVHQFCVVGKYSFITKATYVTKDVLPYLIVSGYSPTTVGINTVGLKRRGFDSHSVDTLRKAYKVIFRRGNTVQEALAELDEMVPDCEAIRPLIDSLHQSTRGIVR